MTVFYSLNSHYETVGTDAVPYRVCAFFHHNQNRRGPSPLRFAIYFTLIGYTTRSIHLAKVLMIALVYLRKLVCGNH